MSKRKPSPAAAPVSTATAGPGTPGWFPQVGSLWPGQGIYAGIMRGEPGQPDYHLFLSTSPASQHKGIAWGGQGTDEPKAALLRDGAANTAALVASSTAHPAAKWAQSLNLDGHADWYLPSRHEARLCYLNCPELFDKDAWYWTSTQFSARFAWLQLFGSGLQLTDVKASEYRARAVRRLLIQ